MKNVSDTFDVLEKDQFQRRINVPSEISDPVKSIASKVGGHVATAVASAKQAVSTSLADIWRTIRPKFLDDLTRWKDTVPIYCCLQTRGAWQLGYPNSTTKIVSTQDFNLADVFQVTVLENLFSTAHQIVPGLPDGLASDLSDVDFGVLENITLSVHWMLVTLLVGTFATIVVSCLSECTHWLFCLPPLVGILKIILLVTALTCMSICAAVAFVSHGILSMLDIGIATQVGTTLWLSVAAVTWLLLWSFLDCVCF